MSPLPLPLRFLQAQPDHRLVELTRNGHEPAFEAIVRRYRAELLAYCRRLQPGTGSAEDVLQQTLLQAWKALNAGTEVRDLRPWLYRIAHNTSLNSVRVVTAVPAEVPDAPGAPEVDQLVEQRMRIRAAFTELAALPTLQRQAFVSSMLGGASHDEVAASLSLSNGAVRGLIYRARSAVRAAAAAVIPSPVLGWAIRRAEPRSGGATTVAQALTGGGGTGLVAALAKGGAMVTLAGAVAGAGGAILTPGHHHRPAASAREVGLAERVPAPAGRTRQVTASLLALRSTASAAGVSTADPNRLVIARGADSTTGGRHASQHWGGRLAAVPGLIGSGPGSSGRSGGGSGQSPGEGEGGPGGSGGGSGGGSDGRSGGSTNGPGSGSGSGTAPVVGTDGDTSGGGSDPKRGGETTATSSSGGSSGSNGGLSGTSGGESSSGSGSDSGSGSSDSVTTSTATESH